MSMRQLSVVSSLHAAREKSLLRQQSVATRIAMHAEPDTFKDFLRKLEEDDD